MNIGFDAKRAFTNSTGLGNYSRFVIKSLLRFSPQHSYYLFSPSVDEKFVNYFPPQHNLHIITPETFIDKTFSSMWRSYGLTKLLEQYKIDVFHGLSNELPSGIEKTNIKSVVTIHDLIFLRYPEYYSTVDSYIYKKKFKNACQHANVVVSVSGQTKQDIEKYFNIPAEKISVIYQDCAETFGRDVAADEQLRVKEKYNLPDQFVLSVGTIEERKNQLTLVKALNKISNKSLKIVFAGRETTYAVSIHEFIQQTGLEGRVVFINQIEQNDLPCVYRLAICSVYISEFEGFGIPVLEAMRCGVPVITSNTSSIPEVGGDAALYINPTDENMLANHINGLISDLSARKILIEKGFKQAEKFDTEMIAKQFATTYQSLVNV